MHKWMPFIVIALMVLSCDEQSVFHKYQSLSGGWDKEIPVTFELTEMDSLQAYNAFITLRANHEYPYSNLFLITQLGYPNGKIETDTLEYKMAAPSGALLGSGVGDVKENKLWYKEGVRFRESGTYTISLQQAMRANGKVSADQKLKGITEVGIRVERQEQ